MQKYIRRNTTSLYHEFSWQLFDEPTPLVYQFHEFTRFSRLVVRSHQFNAEIASSNCKFYSKGFFSFPRRTHFTASCSSVNYELQNYCLSESFICPFFSITLLQFLLHSLAS